MGNEASTPIEVQAGQDMAVEVQSPQPEICAASSSSTETTTAMTDYGPPILPKKVEGPIQPFLPECEVFYEGGPGPQERTKHCTKNPGHHKFLSVANLEVEDLPSDCQTQNYLDRIKCGCDRTVKIIVPYTSINRPDTWPNTNNAYPYCELKGSERAERVGTGFMLRNYKIKYGRCLCHLCKESRIPKIKKYMKILVTTSTHVIYDDFEAARTIFECFYDSEDRAGVKRLYGVKMDSHGRYGLEKCRNDACRIQCVTHDKELIKKLQDVIQRRQNSRFDIHPTSFIISHPHGMSKKVSIGKALYLTIKKHDGIDMGVPQKLNSLFCDDCPVLISCRIPVPCQPMPTEVTQNNASSVSNSSLVVEGEGYIKPSFVLTPGEEHDVQATSTFTLPKDADYTYRVRKDGQDWWLVFPPSTTLALPDGQFLPANTEFKVLDSGIPGLEKTERCVNYDIATCPGSSGAWVVDGKNHPHMYWLYCYGFNHAGVGPDGINHSSYRFYD